jgi:predicted RNA-binding Zn-ribbon protein involved in translation (DUF1610 family)
MARTDNETMRQEEGASNEDDLVRLSLSVSTEQGKFFRRSCPECGQDFKTEVNPADLQLPLAPQVKRLTNNEIDGQEDEGEEVFFHCPYCREEIKSSATFTEEMVAYIHNIANREIVLAMINNVFGSLNDIRTSGGGISVSLTHERGILPPYPIHGPEPPDMIQVEFLCCKKRAKVLENLSNMQSCIYCGIPVLIV